MADNHYTVGNDMMFKTQNSLVKVTLNRPNALNALTQPMTMALYDELKRCQNDPTIKAIIIQGAPTTGGRVPFCSGGDLRFLYEQRNDPDKKFAVTFYEQEYRLNARIFRFSKPYVAIIDGVVMGGGVGISFHGSHRIMTERALFAMPETGIGLFPDVGATYFLPRCPGKMGLYIGLTGIRINAADALYLGLATHHVQHSSIPILNNLLDSEDLDADANNVINNLLDNMSEDPGHSNLVESQESVDRCFSGNSIEEIFDNLEQDDSDWAQHTHSLLLQKSPTSLKITFHQLTAFSHLDFEDIMKVEYRIAVHCNFSAEFYEGIRAQIIDKDRQPRWNPNALADVGEDLVKQYFESPQSGDMTFE